MEYFDIELIYQHLKDNYPIGDQLKLLISQEYHHPKFCHFEMNSVTIFTIKGGFAAEFWQEDFETHEELFQKIHETAITKPTIYQKYLIAKQRDSKIDDIFND